ncbi:hypothetical protein [Actinophytocola sp.]|uniref:hypothetical protein n=1 Tax=Actinophytocola sp. TaxID=1872138 RepID=UPI002D2C8519|nr:hypothetical protein [Actinophytocola sp.]HYQ68460.1 hypothetical protein [Actinophytocola sp.]
MLPYLRRWAVQGTKPNGDRATTIFDLQHDYRYVIAYPATVDIYAVTVAASGIRMLADTANSRTACAVPVEHATYGRRLFGLHPYQASTDPSPPMELYLILPGDEIFIIYRDDQLRRLTSALTEIVASFE